MAEAQNKKFYDLLKEKALWVRKETLKIHKLAQETRIASSLSPVEIFTVLYYGKVLKFRPRDPDYEGRDRFIISKAHGAVSLYPILADLGFINRKELGSVCQEGSLLGAIPDSNVPGFETINGSLGHGLGVACGMALALKKKRNAQKVFVLLGDGEFYEGAVWEAIMFAGEHKIDNLIMIVDNNKICMLDYCKNIIDLSPLAVKFKMFGWQVKAVDGHNVGQLYHAVSRLKESNEKKPKALIANTIKGKGVKNLENDSLCHIKSLKASEIDTIVSELK